MTKYFYESYNYYDFIEIRSFNTEGIKNHLKPMYTTVVLVLILVKPLPTYCHFFGCLQLASMSSIGFPKKEALYIILFPKIANKLHLIFKCFQMKDLKHLESCLRVFNS